jgi:predicted dehydrogenase
MTIHDFDMARYLAGDIVEVLAMGANLVDPSIHEAGDIDAAMVVMRAASGAMVHVNNSRRCAYGYDQRVEAFGERGDAPGRATAARRRSRLGRRADGGEGPRAPLLHRAIREATSPRSTTSSIA